MSKKIKAWLAERKVAMDAAEAIMATATEDVELTDEQIDEVTELTAKVKGLQDQVDAARERDKQVLAAQASLTAGATWNGQTQAVATVPSACPQSPDPNAQITPPGGPDIVGGEDSTKFSGLGEFLFVVRDAALNPTVADKRLAALTPQAITPLNTGTDSGAGFLIPDDQRETLLQRIYTQSELLNRIKAAGMAFSLAGNTLKIPYVDETSRATGSRWGGVRGYWVEESGTLTESEPKVGQLQLNLNKAACLGYITEEMLEDHAASGQFLENAFVSELIFLAEDAIVNGDGANKPRGIVPADSTVTITQETNQPADTLWGPNVVKMWARMWAPSRPRSIWLVNQDVEPSLWGLTLEGRFGSAAGSATGIPIYYPAGTIVNTGIYPILMGRPVIPVEYCATLGTVGDIILMDPGSYIWADKSGGLKRAASIHVRFLTDERTFRVTWRVDGQPSWASKLTPFKGSNTLGPNVLIESR